MDHFAKPNDELAVASAKKVQRNFQGYSTRGVGHLRLGMSGVSQVPDAYCRTRRRCQMAGGGGRARCRCTGVFVTDEDKIRREAICAHVRLSLDFAACRNGRHQLRATFRAGTGRSAFEAAAW